jgi:hypothetical protein
LTRGSRLDALALRAHHGAMSIERARRGAGPRAKLVYVAITSMALALATGACGSDGSGSPASFPYAIDFQSEDAAVSVDTLEIDIFSPPPEDCVSLVLARKGPEVLRPTVREADVDVCDVLTGARGRLAAPYGDASILVVGRKGEKDVLIGCANVHAGSNAEPPVVTLTNFDSTVTVKPRTCSTVAAYCARGHQGC